jgi:hypothetical protein
MQSAPQSLQPVLDFSAPDFRGLLGCPSFGDQHAQISELRAAFHRFLRREWANSPPCAGESEGLEQDPGHRRVACAVEQYCKVAS